MIQHFVSVSGGADSLATALVAKERMQRRADFRPRLQAVDVGNEERRWHEYIDYLEHNLGMPIERLSAYDVPGLCDAAAFERKRQSIRDRWPHELRVRMHTAECKAAKEALPAVAPGCRHSPERRAALLAWTAACDAGCPVRVSPPVADDKIEAAVAALEPTGIAFLDVCLLHGRFPSRKAKFCTEDLKLEPLFATRRPLLDQGVHTVDWVGERADESKDRADKPVLERVREDSGAYRVVYRPIHGWTKPEAFAIAKRHGIKPNPLYLIGAKRVGCWPCINAGKEEVALIVQHTPEIIDKLRDWERRVTLVNRQHAGGEIFVSSFFAADRVPGDPNDFARGAIDRIVEWSKTTHGGRQFDLLQVVEQEARPACFSQYGLCE